MTDSIVPYKKPAGEDCVEPELVDDGRDWRKARTAHGPGGPQGIPAGDADGRRPGPLYAFFLRLRAVFIAGLLLLSFGLIAAGALLTSTLIGAVIGIPLILIGLLPLWLLFRFLAAAGKNGALIFRRF